MMPSEMASCSFEESMYLRASSMFSGGSTKMVQNGSSRPGATKMKPTRAIGDYLRVYACPAHYDGLSSGTHAHNCPSFL